MYLIHASPTQPICEQQSSDRVLTSCHSSTSRRFPHRSIVIAAYNPLYWRPSSSSIVVCHAMKLQSALTWRYLVWSFDCFEWKVEPVSLLVGGPVDRWRRSVAWLHTQVHLVVTTKVPTCVPCLVAVVVYAFTTHGHLISAKL